MRACVRKKQEEIFKVHPANTQRVPRLTEVEAEAEALVITAFEVVAGQTDQMHDLYSLEPPCSRPREDYPTEDRAEGEMEEDVTISKLLPKSPGSR